MSLPGTFVAAAYREACLAELRALKPGNVHLHAPGHAMTVADFEASAEVSADVMGRLRLTVGERIHEAIRRTRAAVGCNTNLGIVLLCAPLAQAALEEGADSVRARLARVLNGLDVADADAAFRAIRLAQPAGLGRSPRHDVSAPATVSLLAAMEAAQDRDRIAAQYVTGFADIFDFGVPRLHEGLARWGRADLATTFAYLGFLAHYPDSHIARKFGTEAAETVRRNVATLDRQLADAADPETLWPDLAALDAELKTAGLNPGTSADLTVASLFALRLDAAGAKAVEA